MLKPQAPSVKAQPISTSSTSAGSIPARATACLTACAPRVAPWVMLKAPFQDLANPVRAVDTMTASVMMVSGNLSGGGSGQGLAFGNPLGDQRGRGPEVVAGAGGELLHPPGHLVQAHLVGIEHRAAAMGREPVAAEIDHVNVRGPQSDAFLEEAGALVDQGIDAAFDDLAIRDLAWRDAVFLPVSGKHLFDLGVGNGVAVARLIEIPALPRLLAEAAHFAQPVGALGVADMRHLHVAALAGGPGDVVTGKVEAAERPHGDAPLLQRLVHLPGGGALFH